MSDFDNEYAKRQIETAKRFAENVNIGLVIVTLIFSIIYFTAPTNELKIVFAFSVGEFAMLTSMNCAYRMAYDKSKMIIANLIIYFVLGSSIFLKMIL